MLEKRYFDGTASDEEERLLLHFAATTTDPAFRELQAVLGFVCTERKQHKTARRKRSMGLIRHAAAAVVFLAVGTTAIFRTVSTAPFTDGSSEGMVAYVGGVRITDEEQIISLMDSTLQSMGTGTDIAEQQLQDMLETLN